MRLKRSYSERSVDDGDHVGGGVPQGLRDEIAVIFPFAAVDFHGAPFQRSLIVDVNAKRLEGVVLTNSPWAMRSR